MIDPVHFYYILLKIACNNRAVIYSIVKISNLCLLDRVLLLTFENLLRYYLTIVLHKTKNDENTFQFFIDSTTSGINGTGKL